ncbi:13772_t:CDS:1, partial [Ambispora leptoticha]
LRNAIEYNKSNRLVLRLSLLERLYVFFSMNLAAELAAILNIHLLRMWVEFKVHPVHGVQL